MNKQQEKEKDLWKHKNPLFQKTARLPWNLQLFAQGGAEGDGGGQVAPTGAEEAVEVEQAQEEGAGQERTPFADLIKGDYKDDFQKVMDKAINRRFAETKATEEELGRYKGYDPVLTALSDRYGVNTDNPEELLKALESDTSHIQAYAEKEGVSLEEAKRRMEVEGKVKELERIKAQQSEERKAFEQQQERDRFNQRIQKEVDGAKQLYGEAFDMEAEMGNPEFMQLVGAGVSVQAAFEVIHKDELLSGAIGKAVAHTKERVAKDMQARGKRPLENGIVPGSGGAVGFDAGKISKEADREIERRVARGEKIGLEQLREYMT
ncbi:MAG: hypothetical protein GX786_00590 [Clostridiales bacterium]|nr:hypothetical protein [Clostridiales bacterium]